VAATPSRLQGTPFASVGEVNCDPLQDGMAQIKQRLLEGRIGADRDGQWDEMVIVYPGRPWLEEGLVEKMKGSRGAIWAAREFLALDPEFATENLGAG